MNNQKSKHFLNPSSLLEIRELKGDKRLATKRQNSLYIRRDTDVLFDLDCCDHVKLGSDRMSENH